MCRDVEIIIMLLCYALLNLTIYIRSFYPSYNFLRVSMIYPDNQCNMNKHKIKVKHTQPIDTYTYLSADKSSDDTADFLTSLFVTRSYQRS